MSIKLNGLKITFHNKIIYKKLDQFVKKLKELIKK